MTQRLFISVLFLLLAGIMQAQDFLNVRDFGAKGNGKGLDSPAFNAAIDSCYKKGGGTVRIPAGTYLCGSIRMKSHVCLYLDAGARIVAAPPELHAYDEAEPFPGPQYQDGGHTYFHNSLIWAEGEEDISIMGTGTIDGQGLTCKDLERSGILTGSGSIGTGDKAIAFKCCKGVLLRDITIFRGGHFAIILTGCERAHVDHVTIDTNRDGIDIDCCKYTTLSNCQVNTPNDDGIVLKSSYALGRPVTCEHILITNCTVTGYRLGTFLDGTFIPEPVNWVCGRIKLGTESNGGYRNIVISNCTMMYSSGLAFEEVDQGRMENISVSNITMEHVHHYPIYITTGSRNRGPKEIKTPSYGGNISISHLTAMDADSLAGIIITGMPDVPLRNISLDHIRIQYRGGGHASLAKKPYREQGDHYPEPKFAGATPAYGLFARHVDGLELDHLTFTTIHPDHRPAILLQDVRNEHLSEIREQ